MDELVVSTVTEWGHKPTFAGVPEADIHALGDHDIVIFGSPIDWGATHRPGARYRDRLRVTRRVALVELFCPRRTVSEVDHVPKHQDALQFRSTGDG